MSEMWMNVDVAITVPVNIFPLIDDTDFKTRETGIVYNESGMDLVWNFVTTAGVQTQTAVTPTTSGDYDWSHKGDGMYNIEIPASGGASINNTEEGFGWFTGICDGVLTWRSPIIGFRAAAINDALIDGGDNLDVNVVQLGGVSQSATDLKHFADSGYDPATSKVEGVKLADTTTTNTDMRGTDSASTHTAADVWAVGTRTLTSFGTLVADIWSSGTRTLTGFSTALAVSVWNVLESAIAVGSSIGLKVKTNLDAAISSRSDFDETSNPVELLNIGGSAGTSAEELVDDVWDEVLTGATHNIATSAGKRLRELADADVLHSGTVQSPYTASTLILESGADSNNEFYTECFVVITDGTGSGQARHIQSYVGPSRICNVVENWIVTPDATSKYEVKVFSLVHTHEADEVAALGAQAKLDVNAECDTALTDYDGPTHTEMTAEHGTINTNVDVNETKIDAVQSDVTNIDGKTTNLPSDPADQSLVEAAITTSEGNVITEIDTNETKIDAVKVDTAAIKAKTDNLPADPAGEASLSSTHGSGSWEPSGGDATEAKQDTIITNQADINTNIDANETKIDAVKVDTAAVKVQTDKMNFTGTEIHSIPKAKDAAVGLSTQEKADVLVEAKKPIQTDTLPEIATVSDVPKNPTIAQATMLHYMDRRDGGHGEDDLNEINNDNGDAVLAEDISTDGTSVDASKLRNPT